MRSSPDLSRWNPTAILLRGVLAVGLLSGTILLIVAANPLPGVALGILILAAYCALSYSVDPQPDYDDVGLMGGLIDHPFRWSDNYNRMLIGLTVLLAPGRFLTRSIWDLIRFAQGRHVMVLPPRDSGEP